MAPRPHSNDAVTARIAVIPRPQRETATALRRLIRAALPRAQESIKWGHPTYSGEGNICSLNPAKRATSASSSSGGGISTTPTACWKARARACGRHIKVRRRADVKTGPFTALLKAADKLDRS